MVGGGWVDGALLNIINALCKWKRGERVFFITPDAPVFVVRAQPLAFKRIVLIYSVGWKKIYEGMMFFPCCK